VTRGGLHSRLVGVLVSAEVALTVVLLVGAGLLVRSAFRASEVETGFNPDNLLTMTISLPANKFDWDHNAVFAREVIEAVRWLSSISDAAVEHGVPMVPGDFSVGRGTIEGYVPANDTQKLTYTVRVVSPGYFATMQIPIVAGRSFEARDEEGKRGAARSILVSESFAKRYWPARDPLGRYVSFGEGPGAWKMTVVGVAGDMRYSGLETGPTFDVLYSSRLVPAKGGSAALPPRDRSHFLGGLDPLRQIRLPAGEAVNFRSHPGSQKASHLLLLLLRQPNSSRSQPGPETPTEVSFSFLDLGTADPQSVLG
jgi:hypothetical protein